MSSYRGVGIRCRAGDRQHRTTRVRISAKHDRDRGHPDGPEVSASYIEPPAHQHLQHRPKPGALSHKDFRVTRRAGRAVCQRPSRWHVVLPRPAGVAVLEVDRGLAQRVGRGHGPVARVAAGVRRGRLGQAQRVLADPPAPAGRVVGRSRVGDVTGRHGRGGRRSRTGGRRANPGVAASGQSGSPPPEGTSAVQPPPGGDGGAPNSPPGRSVDRPVWTFVRSTRVEGGCRPRRGWTPVRR